uniref:Uncharacterized protein n=1 Tax=Arion vulgaris TaxID=1028688 RepID=A0A0B7BMI8_9EUPU
MKFNGLTEQLNGLDFADDIGLLSHAYSQMPHNKINTLDRSSQQLELNINHIINQVHEYLGTIFPQDIED